MSIGGDASESTNWQQGSSSGINMGAGESGTFIDPNQQGFLDTLRELAMGRYTSSTPGTDNVASGVNTSGMGALAQLSGLGNTQQVITSQLEGLRSGLGEIHQQGLNRIGDNAVTAGAFGGARHGITEAALSGEIGDAFTRGYGDIIASASRQAIDANNSVLQGGSTVIGNKLAGDFGGLQALSGLLGDPTILSAARNWNFGQQESQYSGGGASNAAGFDFGIK